MCEYINTSTSKQTSVVVHTCISSIWEAEAKRSVSSRPGLPKENDCLKTNAKEKKKNLTIDIKLK